ncbi:hypothetical protein CspeluHIS016_0702490 [Cutaneotrichosporon spelunceum]|uniref:MHYT domain-containing protein n=1 Tax=Cutaneotrichosporon spelunceum TaxID=1672016 RepID=A0AAD3TYL2_9TREE|nr:hypothetical protein CspeluHIS016_0702490 [Cutaneotrichosporon spelunceum]
MTNTHFLADGVTLNRTDPLVSANEKLAQYYAQGYGNPVPIDPIPGVIVASILVSILGSYATLLVLGRRTSPRGVRNLFLLLLAAVCFAAVAVWGMHFVSMISIRLNATRGLKYVGLAGSGLEVVWYITFSPGMTVLSLFVPLVATAFAFWFLGSEVEFSYWRGLISGVIVGLTIGLMHYSAAFKLPYLSPEYTTVTVVFSLILACIAATVALALFFRLREQWQDSFWKRCVCALALATAVCGMHYLGLGGASYYVKQNIAFAEKGAQLDSPTNGPWVLLSGKSQANRLTVAICVMCACIIALSAGIAIVDYLIRRDIRNKARHIVVASAAFDPTGKLLVRHDGTIPMQIIQTDADLSRVLNELDPRRPTFQWLYQLSFNWQIVTPFVPRILREIAMRGKKKETPAPPTSDRSMNRSVWEQLLFRSRFVEACVLLAHQLDLSIESLGVMFDRVLTTGTRQQNPANSTIGDEKNVKADDESSIHGITVHLTASEGVMLFIVRTIGHGRPASHDVPASEKQLGYSSDNVDSYLARGYRLTETRFFSKTLADNMGVSKQEMDVFLSACKTYAKRGTRAVVQSGGAYLGLFGVRPTSENGLDVLVYNFARHQIPAYRLPDVAYPLTTSMRAFVRDCANLSMGEVLQRCNDAVQAAESSDNESILSLDESLYEFQAAIAVAVEALTTALRCWPDLQVAARLSPEILGLPTSDSDDKLPAQMIVFEVVLGAPEARITPVQSRASGVQAPGVRSGRHDSDKPPAPFVYTPYNLFTKTQTMLMRARGRQDFNRGSQADLARLYPFVANDVAAEIREDEDKAPSGNSRFTSRMSKISKGLSVDTTGGAASFREGAHEMRTPVSPGSDHDAVPPAGVRKVGEGFAYARTAGSIKTDRLEEEEDLRSQGTGEAAGPAMYGDVRVKAEGWYSRSMRTMERNDRGGLLNGVDLSE